MGFRHLRPPARNGARQMHNKSITYWYSFRVLVSCPNVQVRHPNGCTRDCTPEQKLEAHQQHISNVFATVPVPRAGTIPTRASNKALAWTFRPLTPQRF